MTLSPASSPMSDVVRRQFIGQPGSSLRPLTAPKVDRLLRSEWGSTIVDEPIGIHCGNRRSRADWRSGG
jgi:hypothetical protein